MSVNDLIARALYSKKQNPQYAYIAPTAAQAKKIAWSYLKQYAAPVARKVNESELYVELVNGSKIYVTGADNPDSLRGLYLDGVIIDEFAQVKLSLWGEVVRPALSDRKGWAVFLGTPKGKGNGLWDMYRKALADPERFFLLHLKASTSGLLGRHELEELRRDMDEAEYEQEYECSFEAAQRGSYYGKQIQQLETDNKIRPQITHDPQYPVSIAMDIGFNDATAVWFWQVIGGEIRVIEYFEESGLDADLLAERLLLKPYQYDSCWVPHDALHRTFASRKSAMDTLIEHGLPTQRVPNPDAGNRVYHGIDATRKVLRTYPIVIDADRCSRGLEALRNYSRKWDSDRRQYSDTPAHDQWSHGADAFRYLCLAVKPEDLRRSLEQRPQSFLTRGPAIGIGVRPSGVGNPAARSSVNKGWTLNDALREHDRKVRQRRSADRMGL